MFVIIAVCGFQSNAQVSKALLHLKPAADRMVTNASYLAKVTLTTSHQLPKAEEPVASYNEGLMLQVMSEREDAVRDFEFKVYFIVLNVLGCLGYFSAKACCRYKVFGRQMDRFLDACQKY
jgi:hypothetical protein